ncbi:Glycosyl transferase family 2 [Nocardioides exalbidus]|uniref:Glycosyl transferase family 2 n=1 Tax=Nocardioides exalbidus TaxID=402596 RepID=A0A1H4MRT6_9ACTN|nr:glycosyltransferase family 2 protein [Nocardioides exalbidus]SEB85567.1 Glycosyl transferase family 2 [Nocardioides exalbidus]
MTEIDDLPVVTLLVGAPSATGQADWELATPGGDVRIVENVDALRAALAGLHDGQPVVIVEAATTPGPEVVDRLLAARWSADVVDARTLPVDLSLAPEVDMAAELAAVRVGKVRPRMSGCCVLASASIAAEVADVLGGARDDGTGRELAAGLEEAGRSAAVAVLATVVRHADLPGDQPGDASGGAEPGDVAVPPTAHPNAHPTTHPALLPATALHQVLSTTGLLPAPAPDDAADRPFLTVLTRTQGRRRRSLEDLQACLSAQADVDFEWLVVCHRTTPEELASVREVVALAPERLADRIRVVEVERPGRSSPLNDGFATARGRYVAVLDDDDLPAPGWVSSFHRLEPEHAGRVLRVGSLRQSVVPHGEGEDAVAVSVGNPRRDWPQRFDLLDHLRYNETPPPSLAFPRGAFHSLRISYDESLDVTEDWDFLVRTAALVGVTDSPAITAVYHWWLSGETSRSVHDEAHWDNARQRVLDGFAGAQVLLAGDGGRRVQAELAQARERIAELEASQHEVIMKLDRTATAHQETVENWRATEARVEELKERLDTVRTRHNTRIDLLEAIEEILRTTGAERPAHSLYEMGPQQLKRVFDGLSTEPARTGRERWWRR